MAEKIAGIIMREIDQSQPTRTRPEGIPAGVIGTAAKGPAFVPVLFANTTDFVRQFGSSRGGDYFGPIAVAEWMKNAKAGLYLRTLGVGNAEKADSSNGTTAYAGFVVGETMRDKDRTTAGGVNTGDYPNLETDDDVDGLIANPYAGAAVEDQLSITDDGVSEKTGALPETSTITIGNGNGIVNGIAVTDLDGQWITIAESPSARRAFYFIDTVTTAGRQIVGTDVQDSLGASIIDFSDSANGGGADSVHFVDVTGLTLEDEVVNVLMQSLTANASGVGKLTLDASGVDVITTATTVGGLVVATQSSSAGVPLQVAPGGDSADPVNVQSFTLTIADSTSSLYENSSITYEGTEVILASGAPVIDITGLSALASMQAIRDYLEAQPGFDSRTTDATDDGSSVTMTLAFEEGRTLTVFDFSPSAPKGRVHFLGCQMFSSGVINEGGTDDHIQDYLDGAYTDGTKVPVLRGVLMFPGGVVPGLATAQADFAESDVPGVAWGEYEATVKDEGDNVGHLQNGVFQLILNGYTGDAPKVLKASMNPKSSIYFGKIFNTNPEDIQVKGHYLYAHYDIPAGLAVPTTDVSAENDHAFCLPGVLDRNDGADFSSSNDYEPTYEIWKEKFTHAASPWIYSQRLGNGPKKLFRIHALDAGEIPFEDQYKIEISNVHQPKKGEYGTFNLKLRKLDDLDSDRIELESYSGLTLDPTSENFIGRKIGDMNTFFDFEKSSAKQKIVTEGLYPNQSRYIRVEIASQVQAGQMELSALPVGFAGKNHLVIGTGSLEGSLDVIEPPLPFRQRVSKSSGTNLQADSKLCWGLETMSVSDLTSDTTNTAYNATTEKNVSLVHNLCKHFPTVGTKPSWVGDNRNAALVNTTQVIDADVYNNNHFSLEKIMVKCRKNALGNHDVSLTADPAWWAEARYIRNGNAGLYTTEGSPANQLYVESVTGTSKDDSAGYRYLNPAVDMVNPANANLKYYKFVVPMVGGFNGLDIFDGDKKKMNNISAVREMSSPSEYGATAGSTTAAFRKGLDILAEKADVDIQLLAIPGMSSSGISDHAIDKTEDRFDALYLMDIPAYDQDDKLFQSVDGTHVSVINTSKQLQDRNIDSSFAAAYFPNLNMMDPYNPAISVEAPPSCAVLGAMSFNDAVSHPWYAPAGFTRGTLGTVEEGTVILDKDDLETLHTVDINPVTSFANSAYDGMVVWGQKTMLQGKSALDRVNVRRLLIDIRRKVRVVANSILFEPNRESTLAAFSAQVNPILVRIQQQQGLDRFKVVIDSSTTTQQDIENNTIRGKIFLQPVKSIEFISLDFVVGNQID